MRGQIYKLVQNVCGVLLNDIASKSEYCREKGEEFDKVYEELRKEFNTIQQDVEIPQMEEQEYSVLLEQTFKKINDGLNGLNNQIQSWKRIQDDLEVLSGEPQAILSCLNGGCAEEEFLQWINCVNERVGDLMGRLDEIRQWILLGQREITLSVEGRQFSEIGEEAVGLKASLANLKESVCKQKVVCEFRRIPRKNFFEDVPTWGGMFSGSARILSTALMPVSRHASHGLRGITFLAEQFSFWWKRKELINESNLHRQFCNRVMGDQELQSVGSLPKRDVQFWSPLALNFLLACCSCLLLELDKKEGKETFHNYFWLGAIVFDCCSLLTSTFWQGRKAYMMDVYNEFWKEGENILEQSCLIRKFSSGESTVLEERCENEAQYSPQTPLLEGNF